MIIHDRSFIARNINLVIDVKKNIHGASIIVSVIDKITSNVINFLYIKILEYTYRIYCKKVTEQDMTVKIVINIAQDQLFNCDGQFLIYSFY